MADISSEKRQFHRIFYNSDVTLSCDSKVQLCQLIDISLKGCLLKFKEPWVSPLESLYTLKLRLSKEIAITMQVTAVHVIANEAGFKCEHIDIDSISQLRRLVELNLGNSDILNRDLLALTEQKPSI